MLAGCGAGYSGGNGGNLDDEDGRQEHRSDAPLRGHRSSPRWTLDSSRGGSLTGGEGVVPRCLLTGSL